MGFFDFEKNVGKKVFADPADAPQKIQKEIEAAKLPIEDLKVEFNDGVVHLFGSATEPAVIEKAVLISGNIAGVSKVDSLNIKGPKLKEQIETYIIAPGDNLGKISKKILGKANRYPEILEANKEVISHPDKIFPGQKIRMPAH